MSSLKPIGKYDIVRELGKGAMGTVCEGFDPLLERKVAIKTILPEHLAVGSDSSAVERFKREAQAGARLQHPGIVTVYEYAEEDGVTFIAMEYVQGQELLHLMRTRGRFGLADVMTLMRQLLHALDYSHRRGVIHRDIKPANVMVLGDLQIKVMDFGIARIQSSSMTQFGTVLGTPTHMAPEALMGNTADARADLWSAGVMLYELLGGTNPFAADTPAGVMQRVMQVEAPALHGKVAGLPPGLDAVIARALAKDPAHRFQTAEEFLEALTMAARGHVAVGWSHTVPDLDLSLPDAPTARMEQPTLDAAKAPAGAAALELSPLTLAIVESALEPSLGSLAKHLVRSCVKHVSNLADFYSTLAAYIPDPADCDEFLKNVSRLERVELARGLDSAARSGATAWGRWGAFDAPTLERAEQQLTHHVGPLARAYINRAASESGNVAELYRRLAEHIPSEPERRAFLDTLR